MGSDNPHDKRPRPGFSATALIYAGSEQYTCRIIDITKSWLLVFSSVNLPRGTYIRLNITLPGVDEVFDLDGLVMRQGEQDRYTTLKIRFYRPSDALLNLIRSYREWLEQGKPAADSARTNPWQEAWAEMQGTPGGTKPITHRTRAEEHLARSTTGPHYPRVTSSDLNRVVSDDDLRRRFYQRQQQRTREDIAGKVVPKRDDDEE